MKQILCFGDSNTWGLIPKTNQRYPWGVRWTSILDNELNRHFNNEYRVIEEGLCGRTTVFDDPLRDGRNSFKLLPTILYKFIAFELHYTFKLHYSGALIQCYDNGH